MSTMADATASGLGRTTAPDHTSAPRELHPWAWWGWSLGVAVAASLTTNPLLLGLLGAALLVVTLRRRGEHPWGRAIWAYLIFGLVVIAIRLVFVLLFGSGGGTHEVLRLPQVPLPGWAAGVSLGGPVYAERLLGTGYDAMRLALILLAVGAANALANPRRALRSLPHGLRDLSTAVVIAVTVLPQLVASTLRVRRARLLRGGANARRGALVRQVLVPVLEDAVDRSLALAAAMEARGYGQVRPGGAVAQVTVLAQAGLLLLAVASYLTLAGHGPPWISALLLAAGLGATVAALTIGGRAQRVSRYRPPPWRAQEWWTLGCGAVAAGAVATLAALQPALVHTPTSDPQWPTLSLPLLLVVAVVALPSLAPGSVRESGR